MLRRSSYRSLYNSKNHISRDSQIFPNFSDVNLECFSSEQIEHDVRCNKSLSARLVPLCSNSPGLRHASVFEKFTTDNTMKVKSNPCSEIDCNDCKYEDDRLFRAQSCGNMKRGDTHSILSSAPLKSRKPHILIVDDSEANRKMMMRMLASRCETSQSAVDGSDAVDKVKA
eukprot:gene12075-25316_t